MDNQKQPEEQFSEDVLAAYSDHSPVIENVRCLYDFSAKTAEELSFRENDELQILGKVDNDPARGEHVSIINHTWTRRT